MSGTRATNLVKTETIRRVVAGTHMLSNYADLHIDSAWENIIRLRFASEGVGWSMNKRDMCELISVLQEITDAMQEYN